MPSQTFLKRRRRTSLYILEQSTRRKNSAKSQLVRNTYKFARKVPGARAGNRTACVRSPPGVIAISRSRVGTRQYLFENKQLGVPPPLNFRCRPATVTSGRLAGRRITAGQGNTVPQDATQSSFFDLMVEPWLLPKCGDHENKWLNIVGFDRWKDFVRMLDSKSPHFHPHAWARPNYADFSSEILATYDRARRGRPPEANDKKLLNIIGFDRWKTLPGPLHRHRPPITHHPPPPRYNEPLHTPPRPNDPTHRGRQTLRPQNTLREPGLAGHLQ